MISGWLTPAGNRAPQNRLGLGGGLEHAGAEDFVATQGFQVAFRNGGHRNGVAGRVKHFDGIALFAITGHMMVDNDDHISAAQIVLGQVTRQHGFRVEFEGHTKGKDVSIQSSVGSVKA